MHQPSLLFWILAGVGFLGVVSCGVALLLLVVRLLRGGPDRRRSSAGGVGGCLLGLAALLAFVTFGGILLLLGTLTLAGVALDAGLEHVDRIEVEVLEPGEAGRLAEAWRAEDPTAPAAPAGFDGEVVLRVTLDGRLAPEDLAELRDEVRRAVGQGELPPLRVEEPPGLDTTLVEVLLPISADELDELRERLRTALSELRAARVELERL